MQFGSKRPMRIMETLSDFLGSRGDLRYNRIYIIILLKEV